MMGLPGLEDVTQFVGDMAMPGVGTGLSLAGRAVGSMLGSDPAVHDPSAQDKFNDERDRLYSERDSAHYSGDYDLKAVLFDDPFEAMSHDDILTYVGSMQPGTAQAIADVWRKIGADMEASNREFNDRLGNAIGQKWDGATGQSAQRGIAEYVSAADDFVRSAQLVGNKLDEGYTGLQQTIDTMPSKVSASSFEQFASKIPIAGLYKHEQHEAEEARQQAVQVMRTVYMPVVHQADDQVPVLPVAHNPLSSGGPSSPGGPSAYGGPSGGPSSSPFGAPGSFPSSSPTSLGTPPGSFPGDTGAPFGGEPTTPSAVGSELGTSDLTSPASAADRTSPASAGLSPTGAGVGHGSGGGGGSGGGLTGGSLAGAGLGAPGLSPTGSGNAAAAGGSGGGRMAGAAGRPGASGMGGMAPHGGRGKGGEDSEHKTAAYLVNADNGNELVGKMQKVAPPVIGG
jgi:hypothetical protein